MEQITKLRKEIGRELSGYCDPRKLPKEEREAFDAELKKAIYNLLRYFLDYKFKSLNDLKTLRTMAKELHYLSKGRINHSHRIKLMNDAYRRYRDI